MRTNLALWDRVLRFIFGVLLMAWAVAGGPWWAYFGLYLIMSAGWGFCLLYAMIKIRTAKAIQQPLAPPE